MNSKPVVAITGAGGFVGCRLLERLHLTQNAVARPIVRRVGSLPRIARFDLDCRLADSRNLEMLADAFSGCDVVVDSIVGNPADIISAAGVLIPAAAKSGVRRVVFLSSSSVHGQNPDFGASEETPLKDNQAAGYNNAKVCAERVLQVDAARFGIELVILRPGIVFGPRDRWTFSWMRDLQRGGAWWVNEGRGICNSIYVDNLVQGIELALTHPKASGGIFHLGDNETITWRDFVAPLAEASGVSLDSVLNMASPEFSTSLRDFLGDLKGKASAQAVLRLTPSRLKRFAKAFLAAWPEPQKPSEWTAPVSASPSLSREQVELQLCSWRFPNTRAKEVLGFQPKIPFMEGMRRSIEFLASCGWLPSK